MKKALVLQEERQQMSREQLEKTLHSMRTAVSLGDSTCGDLLVASTVLLGRSLAPTLVQCDVQQVVEDAVTIVTAMRPVPDVAVSVRDI